MSSSTDSTLAVKTTGLGKRFGPRWALEDCSIEVPQGRVSALVGPNGAGKTTLLRLLVGLRSPSAGEAFVFDKPPRQSKDFLASVGYLAQQAPLYMQLTAAEHLRLGGHLNSRWDSDGATNRLAALHIPLDQPVAKLSGGQRSQVALSLALAKRPQLLLLDEPVAALDPLARRNSWHLWRKPSPTATSLSCCRRISFMILNASATTSSCSRHREPSFATTSTTCSKPTRSSLVRVDPVLRSKADTE